MEFYPDVLDHLGLVPRELGALQLVIESTLRGPLGNAVATVSLQAAFEPIAPGGVVRVFSRQGEEEHEVQRMMFRLPDLNGGKALRWRLPLELPPDAAQLVFKVEVSLGEDAARVRTAWKLPDAAPHPPERWVAQVAEGEPPPLETSSLELLWEPGQPLPPAPEPRTAAVTPDPAPEPARGGDARRCYLCGFEDPLGEYEHARICPACDASWP